MSTEGLIRPVRRECWEATAAKFVACNDTKSDKETFSKFDCDGKYYRYLKALLWSRQFCLVTKMLIVRCEPVGLNRFERGIEMGKASLDFVCMPHESTMSNLESKSRPFK